MIEFDLLRTGAARPAAGADDLRRDLELDKIVAAASGGDELVAEVWREVLLLADASPDSLSYRQDAVRDALRNRDAVLGLYRIANETVDAVRRRVFLFRPHDPAVVVHEAVNGLEVMVASLRDVLAVLKSTAFSSEAFRQMSKSVLDNINDEFLASAQQLVKVLRFENGVQFSVRIGELNSLEDPVLLVPRKGESNILSKVLRRDEYVYRLDPRDEAGAYILDDIRKWVLANAASTIFKAFKHLDSFFQDLRRQLAFYVGAINLSGYFEKLGLPAAYPRLSKGALKFSGMHCLSLSISAGSRPVPYDLDVKAEGGFAVVVTGANRGGKTTFLKAVGQSLVLARAGLFVPADEFALPSTGTVYTHFPRREDRTLSYGKFEEEVKRLSAIVEGLRRGDYVLMDETFSSTNQVEASVVAEEVIAALVDSGVNVFYVTFLQDFLNRFLERYRERAVLLVPEVRQDGTRTFRLVRGKPTPGYAIDIWRKYMAA
jgi:DNA mismatch repair ATPase MutS